MQTHTLLLLCALVLMAGCARTVPPPDPDRFTRYGDTQCVLDRVNGLVWETKRGQDTLHDPVATYTWYDDVRGRNMSEPGTPAGGRCSLERCDTAAFVDAVNAAGLCGHHDWRLPTQGEALTLALSRVATDGHVAHTELFGDMQPAEYWTATTFRLYPQAAWAWDARSGLERADWKSEAKPVRLVRGQVTSHLAEPVDHHDRVVGRRE